MFLDFFSSFQIFKPYKSSDAVAEVNLYDLAEGVECGGGLSNLVPSSDTGGVALRAEGSGAGRGIFVAEFRMDFDGG